LAANSSKAADSSNRRERSASVDGDLPARTQIDDVAEADLAAQLRQVGRRQVVQRIAAEEHAPAQPAAPARRVAAEVAKIVATLQLDVALHQVITTPASRSRSRGRWITT
jgi:hypothetical protein